MAAERRMQANIDTVRRTEEGERRIAASKAYCEAKVGGTTFAKTLEKRFSSNQGLV
jgi:hypothetical protein